MGNKVQDTVSASQIAGLAMLEFTKEQAAAIEKDLDGLIAFADRLRELNTEGVEITAHIADLQNVMREDMVEASYDQDCMLDNASTFQNGFVTVPVQGQV